MGDNMSLMCFARPHHNSNGLAKIHVQSKNGTQVVVVYEERNFPISQGDKIICVSGEVVVGVLKVDTNGKSGPFFHIASTGSEKIKRELMIDEKIFSFLRTCTHTAQIASIPLSGRNFRRVTGIVIR